MKAELDAKKDIGNKMTLEVKILRGKEFSIRMAIAIFLIKLASKIVWINFELKTPINQEIK